ncbi:MAG: ABC transporter ATP-binding protein [Nitriliruptorales bacterium]|nr:ABC transporter ATP-binding protein [Nitriliruptorales bacterium]
MTGIVAEDVAVTLGGVRILDGISIRVEPGEWLSLIGPNGAGKSTLLRALGGAVRHEGAIALGSEAPGELSHREIARRVAIVPQRPTVPVGLTVTDYVLLGRTPYISYLGTEATSDLSVVAELLERLDLTGFAGRDLTALSGGEFQRAVLARALAQGAPIMLLDEPTSALDVGHAQQVLELIDGLRREHGLTIVTAMHDLTTVAQYADRLLLLADGKAVAAGSPREVLTAELITRHYGANVRIVEIADGGMVVVPVRVTEPLARP